MFNEQLAVLLLIMANQVSDHSTLPNRDLARMPVTPVDRGSLQLKIDTKFAAQPALTRLQRVGRSRQERNTLFASN